MDVKTRNIIGKNYSGTTRRTRHAAYAVVVDGGRVLLSHEVNINRWTLPGGGAEGHETPEECCVREVEEETGLIVTPKRRFLIINELYGDRKFESSFFECEVVGHIERRLTEREIAVGTTPEWISIAEAADIFSRHEYYAATDEERRGIYLREYTALSEFMGELV